MKAKLLLGTVLALSLTSTSFAAEIYKGKLIHSKEWTKGNVVQATFSDVKKSHSNRVSNSMNESASYVYSNIDFVKGVAGIPITISGNQFIRVYNKTDVTKQYRFTMEVCAQTSPKTERCSYHSDLFELEPGGYVDLSKASSMQIIFDSPGTYRAAVGAFVAEDKSEGMNVWANASSMNTILISDANKV